MDNSYIASTEHRELPVVAMRGVVVLPGDNVTFDVGREKSIEAVRAAVRNNTGVILVAQKDPKKVDIDWEDLYDAGVYCVISQAVQLPDNSALRVTVSRTKRVMLTERIAQNPYLVANALEYEDGEFDGILFEALRRQLTVMLSEISTLSGGRFTSDQIRKLSSIDAPGALADAVATRVFTKQEYRQSVLSELDPMVRLETVYDLFNEELQVLKVEHRINSLTKKQIDKNQRDYFLREKLSAIRRELGEDEQSEAEIFRRRMEEKNLPESVKEKLSAEIDRFQSMPPASHEAPSSRAFIECVLDLPWTETTEDRIDIKEARAILERDHYGLQKVKERIVEYLATAHFSGNLNGQIICLVGPPGVGKTSIASSIAEAVGRKFVRMSLGGIDDESEIRGHRRTYVGAMPGRIISAMRQAGSVNPVLLFDEIDKLGRGVHGDPAAAMLEVLDSAQNNAFRDHFLEIPYDLSKVMFITTANDRSTIPRPLLDRMELIEVPGYLEYEKVQIATRHLLPKQLSKHGLSRSKFTVSEEMMAECISGYTRESGVRELERTISSLCRKAACELLESGKTRIALTEKRLRKYLGAPRYTHETGVHDSLVGVCNGLAWTAVGGELLTIEAQVLPGTGLLKLTGNLGDVMKESAQAALTYIRSRADELGIAPDFFTTHDIHVHVPEGAVPKDGPSAGITLMTAMTSAITDTPIDAGLAMTGEITLRGRVLRIGGLREKLLAAIRAGLDHVIVPDSNRSDILEIEPDITDKLHIDYASDADFVRGIALLTDCSGSVLPNTSTTPVVTA